MSRLYFDASYLGKLHWREPGSAEVAACVAAGNEIMCSHHGRAEFYSIGFRKVREGLASPQAVLAVFAQFRADCHSGTIRLLPLTDAIIDRVETVFGRDSESHPIRPRLAAEHCHVMQPQVRCSRASM